ncbi:5307_t:CDS:1, partial [Ambispora leptoticha]
YNKDGKMTVASRTDKQPILDKQNIRQLIRTVKKSWKTVIEEIIHKFASEFNIL